MQNISYWLSADIRDFLLSVLTNIAYLIVGNFPYFYI